MLLHHRRNSGFTVIELLVTIAIIGILVALLIPAVQHVRETSRKTECQNHLHNIGLALASYSATHKGLPPGYAPRVLTPNQSVKGGTPAYAWGTMLLPFVDQKPLYDALDVNLGLLSEATVDPARKPLLERPLNIYLCPSDIAGESMDSAPIGEELQGLYRVEGKRVPESAAGGTSSYVANAGYWATYHPVNLRRRVKLPKLDDERTGPNNGLFYNASHVSESDITDGLSHTLAIGERAWFQGSSTWVGTANLRGRAAGGSAVCLGRVYWRINAIPDPPGILLQPGDQQKVRGDSNARAAFGSYHPGGANFVFADGQARFLAETIDFRNTTEADLVDVTETVPDVELLGVFQKLGIRDDGQVAGTY